MTINVRSAQRVLVFTSIAVLALNACTKHPNDLQKQAGVQEINLQTSQKSDPFTDEKCLFSLVDFEQVQHNKWLTTEFTDVKTIIRNDNSSLDIQFLSSGNISSVKIEPPKPWDFNTFNNYNLAFDVTNNGQQSVQVYLDIQNTQGEYQRRSISIPIAYSGTVYFPLDGIEATTNAGLCGEAPPWKTKDDLMIWRSWRSDKDSFKIIKALTFFTVGILNDKSISIDDVRLRKNPTADPNWMVGVIDKYGQNAQRNTPLNVESDQQLKELADKELAQLAKSQGMPNRSRFGGYTAGPQLEASGFFRTQKIDGKWWMVDPDGYLFFSHGLANVRMANMSTITRVDFDYPGI